MRYWTGQEVLPGGLSAQEQAERLFYAPFAVASHDTSDDPILNYGNQAALALWETTWKDFTSMPSRETSEAPTREERRRLLAQVTAKGYIGNYTGVRISAKGRRFLIKDATVWNLIDESGQYRGQAAMLRNWIFL